ncbi:MAG: hypothetical protein KJ964_06000 [Verrucomicrobia bacterium]|nr:hypothetical protein [Verrucomicrobiota bacterium]MBU1736343.1 hypothetical protein [Verrucomicrobiota bacterium]MBU1857354.1 hypothetical protein [Verrucomicrobiota bacterium]
MKKDIDYFVFIGTYPFGQPGRYEINNLLDETATEGIVLSYASPMEALFARNIGAVNETFLKNLFRNKNRIRAVPILDLSTGTFVRDIRKYHRHFGIEALRIAPNYHGYVLNATLAEECIGLAAELALMVFIAKQVEDVRFQPPCLSVEALDLKDMMRATGAAPKTTIVLNGFLPHEIAALERIPENVYFDVSAFDHTFGAMETVISKHGPKHFVYGSGRPFLYQGAVRHNLANSSLSSINVRTILDGGKCHER